jgi:hypothetical protein
MNFLINQGKTFYWGTSEWRVTTPALLRTVHTI